MLTSDARASAATQWKAAVADDPTAVKQTTWNEISNVVVATATGCFDVDI